MSAKEEGTKGPQEKKTKKKKPSKSSEEKPAEKVEVKDEPAKEATVEEKSETVENASADTEKKSSAIQEETLEDSAPVPVPIIVEPSAKDPREKKATKQEPKKDEVRPIDLEKLSELKEAFSLFDFNHDGIIDLQDLKYTFMSLGKPDYPEEELKKMLSEAKEPCDFDSFVALFGYKASMLEPEDVFTEALATWDMRNVGMIPEPRFVRDIQCFGDKFTKKDSNTALEEAPVYEQEGTSMIDYVKFSSNICGFQKLERTRKYQKDLEKKEGQK